METNRNSRSGLNSSKNRSKLEAADIVLVGALLAAGAVLRLFVPPIAGITPNFIIVMYVISILLLRPGLAQTLGISLVAAAVCHFTSKSAIPYINFISEPIGALATLALMRLPFRFTIGKVSLRISLITFLATMASGLTYIFVKMLILFVNVQSGPVFTAFLAVVFTTAAANAVIAQFLYMPILAALGKKQETEAGRIL